MSGIAGIYNLDGRPVEPQLLAQLTDQLVARGPDAQDVWLKGHIGFGHTLLRTKTEACREHQPCSLDGQVWITADARIDGRAELVQALQSKVRAALNAATDAELILYAYDTWGEACVEHLLGDFVFAIWDARQQRLFCARDQFGIKPFYYARVSGSLVLSNSLNCIRRHPVAPAELNEQAVGDFLLFGSNQETDTTLFAAIRRLPPAHCLTALNGVVTVRRYWTLPLDGNILYRRTEEYVERFKELFGAAVADRLPAGRAGLTMSGGLDSTSVAAFAQQQQPGASELQAFSAVYDRLIPDPERSYAATAAAGLGLPINFFVADGFAPYAPCTHAAHCLPEPSDDALIGKTLAFLKQVAAHSHVALTGWDGDVALDEPPHAYWLDLLRRGRLWTLAHKMNWLAWSQRCLPPLGIRNWLKRRRQAGAGQVDFPAWLDPAFARRVDLAGRWRLAFEPTRSAQPRHRTHPKAYDTLTSGLMPRAFEWQDAGATGLPLELRHPFLDLRLVNFLLSIPVVPWCTAKELLRRAVHGLLPESIRWRPKAKLPGDPATVYLRERNMQPVLNQTYLPELREYVALAALPAPSPADNPYQLWLRLLPLALNGWLHCLRQPTINYY